MARRHILRKLKILLPVCSLLLVFLVLFWPKAQTQTDTNQKRLILNHAKELCYQCLDEKGNTYHLSAPYGVEGEQKSIHIEKPRLKLNLQDGVHMMIEGEKGTLNSQDKTLSIHEGLYAQHGQGHTLRADHAKIYFGS